jgi:hypothetical protein
MDADKITFDSASLRTKDANGFLRVATSHISKEGVNPYYGREIPRWRELSLNPERIYYGYRPGDELAKAAASFNGLPLLFEHHPESADNPQKDYRVGSLGTDAVYAAPYLDNSLIFTDAAAIGAVERGEYRELSSAYRYEPDFTRGEFQGIPYDFVMRNISGNHVAIVQEGRAGPDIVVADEQIKEPKGEDEDMDKFKEFLTKILGLAKEYGIEPGAPPDGEGEPNPAPAQDEEKPETGTESPTAPPASEEKKAEDEDPAAAPEKEKEDEPAPPAMDANAILKKARESSRAEMRELNAAARACEPIIGELIDPFAYDSATDIYKKALEMKRIDTKAYPRSAYKGMTDMLRASSSSPAVPAMAQDEAAAKETEKYFDGLESIRIA